MNRMKWVSALGATVAALAWSAGAQAADWTEIDAGGTLATAESVFDTATAGQSLGHVFGSLTSVIDATDPSNSLAQTDLYRIWIANVSNFTASTFGPRTGDEDTRLFLFDSAGHGLVANDDDPAHAPSSTLSLTGLSGLSAGFYYLGVSLSGTVANGASFANPAGTIFGAGDDGVVDASLKLTDFTPSPLFRGFTSVSYQIDLTGALVSAVPEPATWLMLALGLAGVAARARAARRAA